MVEGMTELNALADRAEAATGPDRELDCLIHLAFNPDIQIMTDTGGYRNERPVEYTNATDLAPKWKGGWADFASIINAPTYTASVDAALSLLPEEWNWELSGGSTTPYAHLEEPGYNPDTYNGYSEGSNAATPALALVAAALRAQGEG